jgi:Protein of unknown function (DUF4231)
VKFRPPFPHELPDPDAVGFPDAVESYLARLRSFYNSRAAWHRRFYRFSGILVIVIGSALPLVATLDYGGKDLVVSLLGVAVAMATALRAFYRWDQSWILLRSTEMAITTQWWQYCACVDRELESAGDDEKAQAHVRREAARELIGALTEIRKREAASFFKDLAFPDRGPA